MSYVPKPGDRFRAEITARSYGPLANQLSYEIHMNTAELIEGARTPGQKAFEVWASEQPSTPSWHQISSSRRHFWESVADAARSST